MCNFFFSIIWIPIIFYFLLQSHIILNYIIYKMIYDPFFKQLIFFRSVSFPKLFIAFSVSELGTLSNLEFEDSSDHAWTNNYEHNFSIKFWQNLHINSSGGGCTKTLFCYRGGMAINKSLHRRSHRFEKGFFLLRYQTDVVE